MQVITINEIKAAIGQWYHHKHLETFKFPKSISISELIKLIETAPTFEAIPIKWIRKWLANKPWQYVPDVNDMLKDWRKENGIEEIRKH